jgi:hypothetical protein
MRRSSSTLPFRQLLRSNSPALRPATGVVDGSRRLLHNRGGQPAGKLISTSCTPRPVGVVAVIPHLALDDCHHLTHSTSCVVQLRGGLRRALASQVPPEADERANKPKKVNIGTSYTHCHMYMPTCVRPATHPAPVPLRRGRDVRDTRRLGPALAANDHQRRLGTRARGA